MRPLAPAWTDLIGATLSTADWRDQVWSSDSTVFQRPSSLPGGVFGERCAPVMIVVSALPCGSAPPLLFPALTFIPLSATAYGRHPRTARGSARAVRCGSSPRA